MAGLVGSMVFRLWPLNKFTERRISTPDEREDWETRKRREDEAVRLREAQAAREKEIAKRRLKHLQAEAEFWAKREL